MARNGIPKRCPLGLPYCYAPACTYWSSHSADGKCEHPRVSDNPGKSDTQKVPRRVPKSARQLGMTPRVKVHANPPSPPTRVRVIPHKRRLPTTEGAQ